RIDRALVDEHVGTPGAVLELLNLADQLAIVDTERMARLELCGYEGALDEDLPRAHGIDAAVAHPAARDQHEPVERNVLVGHHLAPRLVPVRLDDRTLDEMRGRMLDPFGLDAGDVAREHPGRLLQLAGHHPSRAGLLEPRPRPDRALQSARPQVMVSVLRLHADVADEPGEERAMHALVGRG